MSRYVETSAPGKCILFGEHAVVYGVEAIAVALQDLRVQVCCTESSQGACSSTIPQTIELHLEDLPDTDKSAPGGYLKRCWSLSKLNKLLDQHQYHTQAPGPSKTHLLAFFATESPENQHALVPVLFLILGIYPTRIRANTRSCVLKIHKGSLPIGAGLGSSAAMCVATAAALWRLIHSEELDLKEINAWAYAAETFLHGSPSGLDNTISTQGGLMSFQRRGVDKKNTPEMKELGPLSCTLRLLVINSNARRSSHDAIAHVKELTQRYPDICTAMFQSIQAIVDAARATMNHRTNEEQQHVQLNDLMAMNHQVLAALGVGHPMFAQMADIAQTFRCTIKMTGAGKGGCAFTLLPATATPLEVQAFIQALEQRGFEVYQSTIGGPGVRVDVDRVQT